MVEIRNELTIFEIPEKLHRIEASRSNKLPEHARAFLSALAIPFEDENGATSHDASIGLVNHIVDCLGYLRDVVKHFKQKNSVGFKVVNALTSELGKLLIAFITNDESPCGSGVKSNGSGDEVLSSYYKASEKIISVFPEMVSRKHKSTGKMLLHHACSKAGPTMLVVSIKNMLSTYGESVATPDSSGALPLHYLMLNSNATVEAVTLLYRAHPGALRMKDNKGLLPLHWAVDSDHPNLPVVEQLLSLFPAGASEVCEAGMLPMHYAVNRDRPNALVIKALRSSYPECLLAPCRSMGRLPIHFLVDRSEPDISVLKFLLQQSPESAEKICHVGNLPLHVSLDQEVPSRKAFSLISSCFEGGIQVANQDGYLPLHIAVDCFQCDEFIVEKLIALYPEAANKSTVDGLLPLHLYISSTTSATLSVTASLLAANPSAAHCLAVDVVPSVADADAETWTGEWTEVRWTPYSRAREKEFSEVAELLFARGKGVSPQTSPEGKIRPDLFITIKPSLSGSDTPHSYSFYSTRSLQTDEGGQDGTARDSVGAETGKRMGENDDDISMTNSASTVHTVKTVANHGLHLSRMKSPTMSHRRGGHAPGTFLYAAGPDSMRLSVRRRSPLYGERPSVEQHLARMQQLLKTPTLNSHSDNSHQQAQPLQTSDGLGIGAPKIISPATSPSSHPNQENGRADLRYKVKPTQPAIKKLSTVAPHVEAFTEPS